MIIKKDDLLAVISQDLDYARAKFKVLARTLPETIKHALDTCDDKLARWSSKAMVHDKKTGKGERPEKE
ncbi:MAG: hypothetical protein P8010_08005 [Desulfosarcinaceae bacterium]|jgi:hypothetical protein